MSGTIHNKPLTTIRDWRKGEPLLANGVNGGFKRTHDIVRGLQQGVNQPVQVPSVARGGLASIPGISTRRAFRLKEIRDDYLICRELDADGVEAATDTLVAKPWLLQRTPFDGTVRNGSTLSYSDGEHRTSTRPDPSGIPGETVNESQLVIPRFTFDDLLYATLEIYTGVETEGGVKVVWQAADGPRAWTAEDGQ
ncbi:hypothetical protein LCGC14_3075840 [marine sediment metagenome]|uniref:Uncharacterized protein n=1 Tax=marine sediment metagenome TaxID=412755 RepID=A0A0F8X364_9ZZZZ